MKPLFFSAASTRGFAASGAVLTVCTELSVPYLYLVFSVLNVTWHTTRLAFVGKD